MNDDFIHGLQIAYKIVHTLQQKVTGVEYRILQHALIDINKEIDKACKGKIILGKNI